MNQSPFSVPLRGAVAVLSEASRAAFFARLREMAVHGARFERDSDAALMLQAAEVLTAVDQLENLSRTGQTWAEEAAAAAPGGLRGKAARLLLALALRIAPELASR